ncbi:MAG: nucleotidyl transferase AbiEii/AbiGii toxin family protein [Verrucomicrobia bacterium]|nr:nucleotidyl transferase AbiEii/AbiGii toxin family protein [Verrucomicrobiota bacterium]MBU1908964.1 nucleotidyl transferase AbiEii/AbiGii toxin family protein [Verrucomicrobiota bacterium]
MIPRAFIDAWRAHAPWRSDAKVEQDLIICRAVVELFRHPALSEHLVFRGGTAMHKLFFDPPRRYSEDIDLVQIKAGPIGPIFDALRDALTPLFGKPQRKQGPGVVTLTYRMASETPPIVPMKLKVEINSREHFSVMGVQKRRFSMASPWFTGECEVPTFDLNELLATKLRALYQRRKGRDLFDLWLGLTEGKANGQQIVDTFRKYMEFGGFKVSHAEFAANLEAKRQHPSFTADLGDLLPVGVGYDLNAGFAVVEREILPWL